MDDMNIEVKMGTVHLNVSHLERAGFFFSEALGIPKIESDTQSMVLGTNAQPLLILHQVNNPPPRKATTGLYHLALLLPSREDLARMILHLVNNNVPLYGVADHGVSEAIYLNGPDEIGIEIYCDRPEDEWPLDEQGQIEMGTDELDLDNLLMTIKGKTKNWAGLPANAGIGHIHLKVTELENTARFYSLLDLKIVQKYGENAIFLSSNNYHHQVGANTWESAGAEPLPGDTAGLRSFELLVEPTALSLIKERLNAAGQQFTEEQASIQLEDPNGIKIILKEK